MALCFQRKLFKYAKCIVITVLIAFFTQILVAVYLFPSENVSSLKQSRLSDGSAKKLNHAVKKNDKNVPVLKLDENFDLPCDIMSREAVSAINRAKTPKCKQEIINKTCLIQEEEFYPIQLPNNCPSTTSSGTHLGCFKDDKKMRLLSSFYGNYPNTNSPGLCMNICTQGGLPYAGVQYGSECFCGENEPPMSSKTDIESCVTPCPGEPSHICGSYFTMSVYETGVSKFAPRTPATAATTDSVRIVFLLTLNGRALRQVYRLINALYRTTHYFYIHVDARQDYLHRKLLPLENQFPNIKLATTRYSTIWGGASLLKMLKSSMKDSLALGWEWDFVINLSESDFLIKSLEALETFLAANKNLNFVKSHGREVQRFIKKQGLDKTFIECETRMWRVGERKLPEGIVIDGGSDWVALSADFVSYVVGEKDELLSGLDVIFEHTLLPAESFFHTVLRNSHFCNTYVDNNLHVTNWKRKLGCKCQYKHVVDWCGCSPNDFTPEDWPKIQSTQDRQLFFARKFEPIINQEIITRVEQFIGFQDHHLINNLEAYWQSIYNSEDLTAKTDDTFLTHAGSMTRHNAHILLQEGCRLEPLEIIEINSYHYADVYKGNLILHKALLNEKEIIVETWYKPVKHLELNLSNPYAENVKIFKVSSEYDQKETVFRNLASILGPLSEPSLLYQFSPPIDKNMTVVWLDPAGAVAELESIHLEGNNLTNFIKPSFKVPLLPGVWKVELFDKSNIVANTHFLITPLEYFSGKELSHQEASIVHSGSQKSYKDYSNIRLSNFVPNQEEILRLQKLSSSNIKSIQQDLRDWIDSLTVDFYKILGSCIIDAKTENNEKLSTCGKHKFDYCTATEWSSVYPDPKGSIGRLNKKTGRLHRES